MTSPLADDQAVLIIPAADDLVQAWVAAALVGVPLVPRLHATLVVEELVSNARRHASPPYVLRLALDDTRRYLLVFVEDAVADDGAVWPRRAGLTLVEGLTADWAVDSRLRGKTVWAEIALGARIPRLAIPPQPSPGA